MPDNDQSATKVDQHRTADFACKGASIISIKILGTQLNNGSTECNFYSIEISEGRTYGTVYGV